MVEACGPVERFSREHKVPGGKLLRVELSVEKNTIKGVKITGDFFMYPEESISLLESTLVGVPYRKDAIRKKLEEFFKGGVHLIGATPKDLLYTLKPDEDNPDHSP
ncbi:MAG: hypothetical protein DRO11_07085 [Methanobacteriota archaeon]|nr:MAG: hypothetical protein DRO11_07085 [Euryarchaeota archaeon]